MQELRTEPRQRRSQQSIDAILDAAEHLIHRDGQVSFTAAELAVGADMSIGRVYYWFPDIPAVVSALVERTVQRMVEVFGVALSSEAGTATPLLIQRVVAALCDHIDTSHCCAEPHRWLQQSRRPAPQSHGGDGPLCHRRTGDGRP